MTGDDPKSCVIRAAREEDIPRILELIQPFIARRVLLPRDEAALRTLMPHAFVAEKAQQIVGFASLEIYSRKMAEIQCLAVAESCQGEGIGRKLVDCCVRRGRDQQVRELMAITSSEDFWINCGFDFSLPDQRKAVFIRTGDS